MALSDQLTKLAARAREVEDRAATAKAQAKGDLEQEVKNARASAQTQADSLHAHTEKTKNDISEWWSDLGRDWKTQTASIRREVDQDRARDQPPGRGRRRRDPLHARVRARSRHASARSNSP